ncbi:MAG: GNAT family N-acetyltransferase [Piscinibacter sp.]|nr:GNAT family N-acetyltransferase [Piscinibacter sp.]
MIDFQIRRLAPPDAAAHRALMLEAYARTPEAFTSSVAEREPLPLAWWAARMSTAADPRELVLGAFVGAELVGAAGLMFEQRERTNHKATLFGMYVRETARRRGIARALVEAILQAARNSARTVVVQLTVSDGNGAALDLYSRCGFIAFGTEPMAIQFGDTYVAKVHMWQQVRS